jgi:hypothetical protein
LGAQLDRIQIIKGWVDEKGVTHEKVIDVAWSGGRHIDPATGRLDPVGSTVNTAASTYENTIGAPSLAAWWQDDDFNPDRPAFYYPRVLEIPNAAMVHLRCPRSGYRTYGSGRHTGACHRVCYLVRARDQIC